MDAAKGGSCTRFRDRDDAGRCLAEALGRFGGRNDVVVIAVPRGGLPGYVEKRRDGGVVAGQVVGPELDGRMAILVDGFVPAAELLAGCLRRLMDAGGAEGSGGPAAGSRP